MAPNDESQNQHGSLTNHVGAISPVSVALPVPRLPHLTLHIQVTRLETSNTILLTTTETSSGATTSPLGSFVYAMPNRLRSSEPLCTSLCTTSSTIEFATRLAKIIAKRSVKPTYVGCSVILGVPDVEEEMATLRSAVDAILKMLEADEC